MHKIALEYHLQRDDAAPANNGAADVSHPLMRLLRAVDEAGSVSAAARLLGHSYRHLWGELKRWEADLGSALIVWEKGQRARLTPFGHKLMWAERQAQARLAPQIEALRAELERVYAVAFDDGALVLPLFASHDDALPLLREVAAADGLQLDVRYAGSVDAIRALNEGRCQLAAFHTLADVRAGDATARAYRRLLQPGQHKLIGLAERRQGLLVAPGNPINLHSLADVAAQRARFALRPLGSGTRVVLTALLDAAGLSIDALNAVAEEPSHRAVAQAVAGGQVDAGLGLESAARVQGLDFVPLATEHQWLVALKDTLDTPEVQRLRGVLHSRAWQDALAALPGCTPLHSGEVLSLKRTLPWW